IREDPRPSSLAWIAPPHAPDNWASKLIVSSGVPITYPADDHERVVGHGRTVLILDLVQQSNDIAAFQLCSDLVADLRIDKPVQDRNSLIHRPNLGALAFDVLFGDRLELAALRLPRLFGSLALNGIDALRHFALNDVGPLRGVRQFRCAAQACSARFAFVV